jgi:MFS family permease
MLAGVRRLLVLVSVIVFVDAMLFGALTPLVPGYVHDFDLSKTQAGLLVGAFGAGALLGGVPGGLLAGRYGPKRAVVLGLAALAAASIGFALASGPAALGIARFVQGLSSTTTWAGALAWITVESARERRGEHLGTVFGIAVLGAILGPMFGAVAKLAGIRATFAALGALAVMLAIAANLHRAARPETSQRGALTRALSDKGFLTGLWLNTLPAFFFGALSLLAPLALAAHGFGAFAIAAVFLSSGLIETGVNPVLGRISDSRGRLVPIRAALAGSTLVSALLAATEHPWLLTPLVVVAGISFGGFYTPGMALVSDRAEAAGIAQGLGFGVMNSAWALGQMSGPSLGGALAQVVGDPAPYLVCSGLCALTLVIVTTQARALRAA